MNHPNDNLTVRDIARVCHEANRALQIANGDPVNPGWDTLDEDLRQSSMAGVLAALEGADAEGLHRAWCAERAAQGWSYGQVKDPVAKTHPCLTPYNCLPRAQRRKDELFRAIVDTLASRTQKGGERR